MANYKDADVLFQASNGNTYLGLWIEPVKLADGREFTSYKLKIQKPYKHKDGSSGMGWDITYKEIPALMECLVKAQARIDEFIKAEQEPKEVITHPVAFEDDDVPF